MWLGMASAAAAAAFQASLGQHLQECLCVRMHCQIRSSPFCHWLQMLVHVRRWYCSCPDEIRVGKGLSMTAE